MRVPCNESVLRWEYTANKVIDKRDTKEHISGSDGDDAKRNPDTERPKTNVKWHLSFDVQRLFGGCP